jgi:hypothetical protein
MNVPIADSGNSNYGFDPKQAAALLDQTTQRARRQLEPYPAWQLATRAGTALIGFGAIWLSVRGQHPYLYPTAAIAPAGVAIGVINLTTVIATGKRASAGVTGRSRLRPAEISTLAGVMAGVVAVMVALISAGVSHSIVYGVYPASVPLIAGGLTWAAIMARRGNRSESARSAAVAAVGVAAIFAGAAGSWLVCAVGVSAVLLASAAIMARRQHA